MSPQTENLDEQNTETTHLYLFSKKSMSHRFKCTHRRLHRGFHCSHIPVWLVHFGRKLGVAFLLSFQRLSEIVEI